MNRTIRAVFIPAVFFFGACGSDTVSPPTDPPPEMNNIEFKFEISDIPAGNGAIGTIFEFESFDRQMTCSAGFISHTGTRIHGNQNDIEFWCASSTQKFLNWIPLPRPLAVDSWSMIANIGGKLYDYMSTATYDFPSSRWVDAHALPFIPRNDGDVETIRRDENNWVLISNYAGCPGISVLSERGYHGTAIVSGSSSAALVWREDLYYNAGGIVWKARTNLQPLDSCRYLDSVELISDPNFVYAMLPVGERLFIGGGGHHYTEAGLYECAPVYATDGVEVEVIELPDCIGQDISEIYSFALADDGLYLGTYPDGYLYRIDLESRTAVRSDLPLLPPNTWVDSDGSRYLESQAVAVSAGRILVGVFPWGEIFESGHRGDALYRLYPAPERTDAQQPFGQAAEMRYCFDRPEDEPDCISDSRPEFWGQRITSFAVMNGRICAGTGNTFRTDYNPTTHTFIDAQVAAQYGLVHCASIDNQTLGIPRRSGDAELIFRITRRDLIIEQDSVEIARRAHQLNDAEYASIAGPNGSMRIGSGVYGPAQAAIVEKIIQP